jgi:hypothetical protein
MPSKRDEVGAAATKVDITEQLQDAIKQSQDDEEGESCATAQGEQGPLWSPILSLRQAA